MNTGSCAQQPLFTFGVIADIQYADIDNGLNFAQTRTRYYRSSLLLLRNALDGWGYHIPLPVVPVVPVPVSLLPVGLPVDLPVKPSFILQLGDIIDGFNKKYEASDRALETVLNEFDSSPVDVHHVWGNHEFYNFNRETLLRSRLNSRAACEGPGGAQTGGDIYAYHFSPVPRFRFILLDAYDVSVLGREETSVQYQQAMALLQEHNSNKDLNYPPASEGLERRFVKFNGGFSQKQLAWLEEVLTRADGSQEKVTVLSHLPVHPCSTDPLCLAWNYQELLSILQSHRSVVCFIAGHDHEGGYHRDPNSGVHYLTLEGVIETPLYSDAFGTVSVYQDRMLLKGNGRIADRELLFP